MPKRYGLATGLRALGILVCSEAGGRLLSLVKNLKCALCGGGVLN
ncbi:MAG: hypothetical protein QXU11_10485 [Thermoproteota archaeon]